jgi:hypothetical protein
MSSFGSIPLPFKESSVLPSSTVLFGPASANGAILVDGGGVRIPVAKSVVIAPMIAAIPVRMPGMVVQKECLSLLLLN